MKSEEDTSSQGRMLRLASDKDAAAIAHIHLTVRASAAMPPCIHSDEAVQSRIAQCLKTEELWVAEQDGQVAGYVRFSAHWLDDLYVLPHYQGSGLGTALLQLVKTKRPAGFSLWVFQSNILARSFYRHHGLEELESTDGKANEEQSPDVRMAWLGIDPKKYLRGQLQEVDIRFGDLLGRRSALAAR
ncbi:acyl-CoA N-acyltransferase [Xylariales sp. PMI_506]|nr:acyl-CoA N-acyltransferase [Xylariales sp. PMI_506]